SKRDWSSDVCSSDLLDELDIPADRTLISAVAGLATDQLVEHLPHSPTIVRIIPLPAVRERKGVTAMYPANQAVEEILGRLGGSRSEERRVGKQRWSE